VVKTAEAGRGFAGGLRACGGIWPLQVHVHESQTHIQVQGHKAMAAIMYDKAYGLQDR